MTSPSTPPIFFLLAGPNGAGKSTLYAASVAEGLIPSEAEFVNADLYEAANLQHMVDPSARSQEARRWADERRAWLLKTGETFVSETVFSHHSKLDLIASAQAAGFKVVLLVVSVNDPAQLPERVAQRVLEGGHPVPPERVLSRYPRTMANLAQAVAMADLALLYDTSGKGRQGVSPHRLVARSRAGKVQSVVKRLPAWTKTLIANMPGGQSTH
ncbi:AAA family ATPase [Hydrogenophaga sp. 5NK40-0174]|uniref:AAA family ATPase n=1 Tax=Hydrogenophaga sp. 5NK40-0174 TaxID=3127649 RepID=UPI003106E29F